LFNFFQPSFKLASKQRDGARVTKRYHPPQTPCERLLQADSIAVAAKGKLREISANLDPLKLLEEMRAVQAYLAALADGDSTPPMSSDPPNLAAFVASLSSAWHMGEMRPTFATAAKPRYLRGLERMPAPERINTATPAPPVPPPNVTALERPKRLQPVYATPGEARVQALRMAWPIVCRRLESLPIEPAL
jgi:hypothetical protein